MADERQRTKYCERCKRRHDVTHEHFKGGSDRAANAVTGSKSAEDLAEQAGKPKTSTVVGQATLARVQQQTLIEQREMLAARWQRRWRMVYGMGAKLLDDEKIALNEREGREHGECYADLCIAFGWLAGGKLEMIADCAMLELTTVAARSEWGKEIMDKLIGKKDKEDDEHAGDPRYIGAARE